MSDEDKKISEFTSSFEILNELNNIIDNSKNENSVNEEVVVLKSAYMILGEYFFDKLMTSGDGKILISGVIATMNGNSGFDGLKVEIPPNERLTKLFTPLYQVSSYGHVDISEYYFYKANITLLLKYSENPETGKKMPEIIVKDIQQIDHDKEINDNETITNEALAKYEGTTRKEKAISIIKQNQFLVGFVGIKNMIIPIVFDKQGLQTKFKRIANYPALKGTNAINNLLIKMDTYDSNKNRIILKVPIFLAYQKLIAAQGEVDKSLFSLFRANRIALADYIYINHTTLVPFFIQSIESIFDIHTQFEELKTSTFVNEQIGKDFYEEINFLIDTNPLTIDDLEKNGISFDNLEIILRLTGIIIKEKYKFNKDTLYGMLNLFNVENFVSEESDIISDTKISAMLAILQFKRSVEELHGEYKASKSEIKEMVDKEESLNYGTFRKDFMKTYGISVKRMENIRDDLFDNQQIFKFKETEKNSNENNDADDEDLLDFYMTDNALEDIKEK